MIVGQKGLEDFLNFVWDEGAAGSNPVIPILEITAHLENSVAARLHRLR